MTEHDDAQVRLLAQVRIVLDLIEFPGNMLLAKVRPRIEAAREILARLLASEGVRQARLLPEPVDPGKADKMARSLVEVSWATNPPAHVFSLLRELRRQWVTSVDHGGIGELDPGSVASTMSPLRSLPLTAEQMAMLEQMKAKAMPATPMPFITPAFDCTLANKAILEGVEAAKKQFTVTTESVTVAPQRGEPLDSAMLGAELIHYAKYFTPLCGVDDGNQRTTAVKSNTTCPACKRRLAIAETP